MRGRTTVLGLFAATALAVAVLPAGCKSNAIAVTNNNGAGVSDGATRARCHAVPPVAKPGTAAMELMGLTDGVTCYWIDQTEVTVAQYAAFLADPATRAQGPACAGHGSFAPDPACLGAGDGGGAADGGSDGGDDGGDDGGIDGGNGPAADLPMACVDWCDAWAYCAWAGKSLCKGASSSKDPATSRWFSACTEGGAKAYPNGDGQSVGTCNATTGGNLAPVGTSSCATADGVQDLSGNVAEWTDECSAGECNVRGGSVQSDTGQAACISVLSFPKVPSDPAVLAYIGFRCCADAPTGSASPVDH